MIVVIIVVLTTIFLPVTVLIVIVLYMVSLWYLISSLIDVNFTYSDYNNYMYIYIYTYKIRNTIRSNRYTSPISCTCMISEYPRQINMLIIVFFQSANIIECVDGTVNRYVVRILS